MLTGIKPEIKPEDEDEDDFDDEESEFDPADFEETNLKMAEVKKKVINNSQKVSLINMHQHQTKKDIIVEQNSSLENLLN